MPPLQDENDSDSSNPVEKSMEGISKNAVSSLKDKKKADFLLDSSSDSDDSSSDSSKSDEDNNDKNKSSSISEKSANKKAEKKKCILKINSNFAKEFQERKQREELIHVRQERKMNALKSRLEDDEDDETSSSSDESEDEDADLLTPGVDLQILKTINALRKKDKSIYDSKTRFFEEAKSEENDDSDNDNQRIKKHKSKYYKDLVREQIVKKMNQDKNDNDELSDNDNEKIKDSFYDNDSKSKLEYDEEQVNLRKAFLDSNEKSDDEDDEDGDDWLIQKKGISTEEIDPEHEKLVQKELEILEKQSVNSEAKKSSDSKEDADRFLFDFIKNKRWVEKSFETNHEDESNSENEMMDSSRKQLILRSDGHDSESSLDELEKMDQFESKYNFRFEEAAANNDASGAGYSVVGYSRSSLSNSIRRQDDTRKQKRLQRKERKEAERKAKEEQLRRLKNAKRQELEERLKEIQSVLGDKNINMERDNNIDEETMMKLMEGDFDPEKFDELMSKNYGEQYYDEEEQEWENDADVKESLKNNEEDVVLEEGAEDGGLYDDYEEKVDEDDSNYNHQSMEWGEDDEEYYEEDEKVVNSQEETQLEKKLKEKMLDELYKLDYEDLIGDMPTRFKYRKVEANTYGLRTEEILFSRDTTLKQFVSLKKMAPYIEDGEYHPDTRKRRRFRDMAKHDYEELMQENEMQQHAEDEERERNAPAKKKRRRQKKGTKKVKAEEKNDLDERKLELDGIDKASVEAEEVKESKKRRRKKKGKKLDKKDKESGGEEQSEFNDDIKAPSISDTVHIKTKKHKTKKRKDNKSNKKESSEGQISSSRLASYGL